GDRRSSTGGRMMSGRKTLGGVVFLAGVLGFSFRWGEREAGANPPPPCPKQPCISVYAWWVSGSPGGPQCYASYINDAAQKGGAIDANRVKNALPSAYAKTNDGGFVPNVGKFARYIFADNFPECGIVNGNFQSPQRVKPALASVPDGNNWILNRCDPPPE
ncbi:MAG: hypothetical protein K2X87_03945, partial [Gemmataceae bacterium]|nr:hypothetical protein [Gemmataceae bacterium]